RHRKLAAAAVRRRSAQWTLARHAYAPWKARRRIRHLREHVQVALARARKRRHSADFAQLESQLPRRTPRRPLLLTRAPPAPVDERSAGAQKRRRVLEHHRL